MIPTPEKVLDRVQRDVEALRRRGLGSEAQMIGQVADEFGTALEPIKLVSEDDAVLRSGKSRRWLRDRHEAWARVGGAGWDEEGNRLYRLCVLPTRIGRERGAAEAATAMEGAS